MPANIITIEHTYDLPACSLAMIQVDDAAQAIQRANGHAAYLYQSKIIDSMYLFIPVIEL